MVIVLNKTAGSGTAMRKWNKLNLDNIPNVKIYNVGPGYKSDEFKKLLRECINQHEYEFAAAGGDGTLNQLLNSLLEVANSAEIKKIKIGAIGVGSSNDFHKPFNETGDPPVKIDFSNAIHRDVGYFTFKENGSYHKKYFIINASIGITAEGNYNFNHPVGILKHIKKRRIKWAIIYTALKTLLHYKNQSVQIYSEGRVVKHVKLTNLGIIKNQNFSDNLSYGGKPNYYNGFLQIHLSFNMNIFARLKLFRALQKDKFHLLKNVSSWNTKELVVNAEQKFYVEFDGEVIKTDNVRFGIHQNYIRVCQ